MAAASSTSTTSSAYGDTGQLSTPLAGAVPGTEVSQIRMDPKPLYNTDGSDGPALTQPADDCAQPTLDPAQTEIAMICTPVVNGAPSSTESDLVVASFDAATGTLGSLDRLVVGTMAAAPAWSPDGTDLIYLAPEAGDGYLELWYLKGAAHPHPLAAEADHQRSGPRRLGPGLDQLNRPVILRPPAGRGCHRPGERRGPALTGRASGEGEGAQPDSRCSGSVRLLAQYLDNF